MRTLEKHELNEVSGAGLLSDVGALLDNGLDQIGSLINGTTKPTGTNTFGVEVGNIVESTFKSVADMFCGFFKRK